jgi:hypothetical protein
MRSSLASGRTTVAVSKFNNNSRLVIHRKREFGFKRWAIEHLI